MRNKSEFKQLIVMFALAFAVLSVSFFVSHNYGPTGFSTYPSPATIDGKFDGNSTYTNIMYKCSSSNPSQKVGSLYYEIDSNGDIEVYYEQNKNLNDNSYGANIVNWSRSHSFSDLTGSDKAEFVFRNCAGQVVLDFTVDYISSSGSAPSGYACLGVSGGEGRMNTGSAANVLAAKTSLDYSFNVLNYVLTSNSPPTISSSNYSLPVSSPYTGWLFEDAYEVKVSGAAFGTSGFCGNVEVVSVHNSPPKYGANEMLPVDCPSVCGNGILEGAEECDDGNTNNGDGCSSNCAAEDKPAIDGKLDIFYTNPIEQCDAALNMLVGNLYYFGDCAFWQRNSKSHATMTGNREILCLSMHCQRQER
jgi:cysteine-rich repeat protein